MEETIFKKFESSEGNVWKYVFDFGDAVVETVLYRYESFEKRTVICCSVQCGCPVGCSFCGTGKQFIRNLTASEILRQVKGVIKDIDLDTPKCEKLQIMFMSMGEPMLNMKEVEDAVYVLHDMYDNAQLLISTVGIRSEKAKERIMKMSSDIEKVGLQFSIHEALEHKRNVLIPFENKLSLREIRDFGIEWFLKNGRQVYLNYCVTEKNTSLEEINILKDLFPPAIFAFTFSVVCSPDESMKSVGFRDLKYIDRISSFFIKDGYNVRIFDPAGQDDIGGGCGQLWYVQDFLKTLKGNK